MKVLIVCPRLCHGGAERVAVSLANGFIKRGHQVIMSTNLYDEVTYHVDELVILRDLVSTNSNKVMKWLSAVKNIRHIAQQEKPDVIIGIMALCSLISRIGVIGINIPVIATEHDAFERPSSAPMPWGIKFAKFYLNRIYKCVTVLTEADKRIIVQQLENVVVMPNPLAIKPALSIPPKEKIIVAAGRIDNWHVKGFDNLVHAWGRIACKYPDWKLQIAGVYLNPMSHTYLTDIAKSYQAENRIEYIGFIEDMTSVYQKAAIFVLSSRYEGFGLVLIEAMSQGCACIACDYNGRQREIITNENEGVVCPPDDIETLSLALEKVIDDETYRTRISQGGLQRSIFYSVDNIITKWEQLIHQQIMN